MARPKKTTIYSFVNDWSKIFSLFNISIVKRNDYSYEVVCPFCQQLQYHTQKGLIYFTAIDGSLSYFCSAEKCQANQNHDILSLIKLYKPHLSKQDIECEISRFLENNNTCYGKIDKAF